MALKRDGPRGEAAWRDISKMKGGSWIAKSNPAGAHSGFGSDGGASASALRQRLNFFRDPNKQYHPQVPKRPKPDPIVADGMTAIPGAETRYKVVSHPPGSPSGAPKRPADGSASAAAEGSTVSVHASGRYLDKYKGQWVQFYYTKEGLRSGRSYTLRPLRFTIGAPQSKRPADVVRGLELACVGQEVGEVRSVKVPPTEGFGADGLSGCGDSRLAPVPPHVTLHYEVELIGCDAPAAPAAAGAKRVHTAAGLSLPPAGNDALQRLCASGLSRGINAAELARLSASSPAQPAAPPPAPAPPAPEAHPGAGTGSDADATALLEPAAETVAETLLYIEPDGEMYRVPGPGVVSKAGRGAGVAMPGGAALSAAAPPGRGAGLAAAAAPAAAGGGGDDGDAEALLAPVRGAAVSPAAPSAPADDAEECEC